MSFGHEEGPVYYREIQKNAYLKRIPNEMGGSKLRPLGHKKPPLKPMWTLFCVHNGRSPYLEQYPLAECPATLTHKPVWRACLSTARHVTASVKPHSGREYDFLVDTDRGPVRMLAPDWDSMQDWVLTLRNKLHELRILSKGENVYCPAPAAPTPRAAARDPTSPLPPTPPVPPDRVPGIELTTPTPIAPTPQPEPTVDPSPEPPPDASQPESREPEIDISNWEDAMPSTSQESNVEPRKLDVKKSVAKICGQNICLDDSVLKRSDDIGSDEEFFNEIDRISGSVENIDFESMGYKQTLMVTDKAASNGSETQGDRQATNVTVIQVSNKGPPHTAIPILGPEVDIFDFNFHHHHQQQQQQQQQQPNADSFVNIVNTEVNVNDDYGTVFAKNGDYGHLSLTTTVNVTKENVTVTDVKATDVNVKVTDANSVYERLCMASTSNEAPVSRVKNLDRLRKSSLPNLDTVNTESTYEYLFPTENSDRSATVTVNAEVNGHNGHIGHSGHSEVISNSERVSQVTVSAVSANVSPSTRLLRANVERSNSQNACDTSPRMREHLYRRVQNSSPKREGRSEKTETQTKPIWKRGLTELSLLTRLRGIGQGKRHESPTRQEQETIDRGVTSPNKVVHRSRPEGRTDSSRRRSSSLSNGPSPPPLGGLVPLRRRQALALQAEQRRRAALPATVPVHNAPVLAEYDSKLWIAWWSVGGARCNGRSGDRLAAVRGSQPRGLQHARQLINSSPTPVVDLLFHRVPLGKMYVLNKRDQEGIGIKLDGECNIVSVTNGSAAARAGLPPAGKWAVTEVNNRPLNLVKGGEEEMLRISMHGTEVSILIQPSSLVKKLRAAIKANKNLLSMR